MAYGYPNYGSPHIPDYASAKELHDSIKPIRGRAEECRPIGARRNTHLNIWENQEGDILCRLYQTDCVIFKQNGDIHVTHGGWRTTTTASFIGEVLGQRTSISNNGLWLHLPTGSVELCGKGERVSVLRNEGNGLVLLNPTTRSIHKVNRAVANNVRSKYKDFRKYIKGMLKVRDDNSFSKLEYEECYGLREGIEGEYREAQTPEWLNGGNYRAGQTSTIAHFLSLIDTPETEQRAEAFYEASLMLAWTYGSRNWTEPDLVRLTEVQALRGLDEVLFRAYRDEIFVEVELSQGEDKRDPYAKFFA